MLSGALLFIFNVGLFQVGTQRPGFPLGHSPVSEVRTTASATRTIPPDLAVLRFEVSARDSTPGGAARAAAAIGEAIRKAVAKAGIPADSILGRGSLGYSGDQTIQLETKQIPNSGATIRLTSIGT